MEKITKTIAEELKIRENQVENTIKLIDEGNTIPFIARYRKEVTGGLSDETLRELGERLAYLRNLEKRKEEVINSIEEQGKLTTTWACGPSSVPADWAARKSPSTTSSSR